MLVLLNENTYVFLFSADKYLSSVGNRAMYLEKYSDCEEEKITEIIEATDESVLKSLELMINLHKITLDLLK